MKKENFSVPALQRGLDILKYLADNEHSSLEIISRDLSAPKSSLLRILQYLVSEGYIFRSDHDKTYSAAFVLVERIDSGGLSPEKIQTFLDKLSGMTGCTAEWYVPSGKFVELIKRSEPVDSLVSVKARLGYKRQDGDEFEAVTRIAYEYGLWDVRNIKTINIYQSDGIQCEIDSVEATGILVKKDFDDYPNISFDNYYNTNGIRRFASVVRAASGSVEGIAALAQPYRPGDEHNISSIAEVLSVQSFHLEEIS